MKMGKQQGRQRTAMAPMATAQVQAAFEAILSVRFIRKWAFGAMSRAACRRFSGKLRPLMVSKSCFS